MMRRKPQWHYRLLLLVCGVALVVLFVMRIGPGAVLAQLARVGPEALLIVFPYALGTAIGAFPWAWLLDEAIRPRARALVASRFAASGANALLPLFGLAGEPSRLLWLPGEARAAGLAAIVVDRTIYNVASALLLLLGALVSLTTKLPRALSALAAGTSIAILLVTMGALFSVARFGVGHRLHQLLRRFLGQAYGDGTFGAQVDAALQRQLRGPRAPLVRGLCVHFAGRFFIAAEAYVALWSLGAPVSPADAFVIAAVPIATALVASSIPSQIGVQEGAQAFTCAALGLPPAVGIALVLLQRLRQLLFVPLTPLLVAAARASTPSRLEPDTTRAA